MRRFLSLLFVWVWVTASPAAADSPLADINGIENADLRQQVLDILGRTEAGPEDEISMRRNLRTAQNRAIRYLRSQGYYAVRIDSELDEEGRPLLSIELGTRYTVGRFSIEAFPDTAANTAEAAIQLAPDQWLTADWVLENEAMGLAAIENAGWPEADILEREVIIDHAAREGTVTFRYNPGPFSRYGGIDLASPEWRAPFIGRLASLQPGDPVALEDLDQFEARLGRLESVRRAEVRMSPVGPDGEETRPVIVELEAAPRHAIEASLGYSTTEGAGLNLGWSRRNMFAGDETLNISSEVATLVQSLSASLTIPHWRRADQGLVLTGGLKSEDTDAFQQEEALAGFSFYRDLTDELTFRAGTSFDYSRVTDALGVRDISSLRGNVALALDQRDDPLDPSSGVHAAVILRPGYSFGDTSPVYLQTELRGSAYYSLAENLVLAARTRIGMTMGTGAADLAADQRFYAGGGGSARGFEFQSLSPIGPNGAPFGGLSVIEMSGEARWRSEGRWGAAAFVDSAFASASRTPQFDEMRAAFGVGVRYHLDFAPIRFDIATPFDRRPGEDAVHFYISIGQAF
ncbi:autotransporter assembly complex protein TamA [Hyphobacterium sp.]|uniref:autotransporter assembly complex protein TamA n=1 Tax=Hyphobacterium sp. TaxID=2004662 RepID=UPI003BA948BA